ncbi:MAG: hypothetical protein ACI9EF_002183 [Pseudohongiellaceae bacterium]|jgi:hypothetical protein
MKRTPQRTALHFIIGAVAGALIAGLAEASNQSIDPRAVIVTAFFGGFVGMGVGARPWEALIYWLIK